MYACRELAVETSEAVLIAAHPWDVHGARRAGLRAAWLNRAGTTYPEIFERPDAQRRRPAGARAGAGAHGLVGGAGRLRQSGTMATTRAGAALAPTMGSGKHAT